MPDARLARARLTLPEDYQFGDAKPPISVTVPRWRAPHVNAAEQLTRRADLTFSYSRS